MHVDLTPPNLFYDAKKAERRHVQSDQRLYCLLSQANCYDNNDGLV